MARLFEHLVCNQILHEASARDGEIRVHSYRREHGAEVDVIVEIGKDTFAIEVKASKSVAATDLRGLQSFRECFGKGHRAWILYLGTAQKQCGNIETWPWKDGIREMFPDGSPH